MKKKKQTFKCMLNKALLPVAISALIIWSLTVAYLLSGCVMAPETLENRYFNILYPAQQMYAKSMRSVAIKYDTGRMKKEDWEKCVKVGNNFRDAYLSATRALESQVKMQTQQSEANLKQKMGLFYDAYTAYIYVVSQQLEYVEIVNENRRDGGIP